MSFLQNVSFLIVGGWFDRSLVGQSVILLKALMLMLGNNVLALSRPFLSHSKINAY